MSGELIGHRYRVLRKIGEGGMAIVSIAVDEKLGRDVAIKVLKERYENHDEIRVRFQHEARAISAFDHPNILKIFDFSGEDSKQLWIVTELIHGRNLAQILETTPSGWLHPLIAASIVREICRALTAAHEHGVVHRDVKPENVMITHHGAVKLMDFGIAKIQRINSMTQTGMFMGSPSYMSPEQVRGRDVDHRSDIYSLGVLFYELITGKLPYSGTSTADIAMKILGGEFVHPRFIMEGIPSDLDKMIVKCLDLNPENRPQTIEEVGQTLDQILNSMGLDGSMQELERCFKDPKAYGDRLAKILKVTDAKPAPTLLVSSIGKLNNEAIRSPIPRPDISAENLPLGTIRRDHLLPPHRIPHVTKRPLSPDVIAAHLPERRQQQRIIQTTRHMNALEQTGSPVYLPSSKKKLEQNQRQRPSVPSPAISIPRPPAQSRRRPTPVSRTTPVVPKRVHHRVRYVIHERPTEPRTGNVFGIMIAILLILTAGGILWLGIQRNLAQQMKQRSKQIVAQVSKPSKQQAKPPQAKDSNPLSASGKDGTAKESSKTSGEESRESPNSARGEAGARPSSSEMNKESQRSESIAETIAKSAKSQNKAEQAKNTSKTNQKRNDPNKRTENSLAEPTKQGVNGGDSKNTSLQGMATSSTVKNTMPVLDHMTSPSLGATDEGDTEDDTTATPAPRKQADVKRPKPVSETQGRGSISIASMPAAELFINGKRHGTTNDLGTSSEFIDLPAGSYRVDLKRSGFTTRSEVVQVEAGSRHKFGPYTLQRGESDVQKSGSYRLTLVTNNPPAEVTILNVETRSTQSLNLSQSSQTINLDRGVYEVTMKRKADMRKRRIDLTGAAQQLTFGVEFRD